MSNIIQTWQVISRNTYVYTHTYMHMITVNEKGIHDVEREQGVTGIWDVQKEGEGRNIVTLKSQKSDSVIKILKQFGQSYRVSFKAFQRASTHCRLFGV